ncbi:MAG: methylation-associated defense system AAA family ATPase MAD3 [Blastocatellia bacterium]
MISLIEATGFRCLKHISQPLQDFQVLVGPNASGKTTFLDVVAFLGRLVSDGPEAAVSERTQNFQDLVWGRVGTRFELAVEVHIPQRILEKVRERGFDCARYEIALEIDEQTQELSLLAERVQLKKPTTLTVSSPSLFPVSPINATSIILSRAATGSRTIVNKKPGGNDNFYSEVTEGTGKGWAPSFKLGPRKSALGNLPEDESRFPVSTWLKGLLTEGVQSFVLNSQLIRKASPPGLGRGFKPDGSNLPWVIHRLQTTHPERFQDWIAHLQTALPDIESIRTVERADDKHRYLMIRYRGGLEVPSWTVSDGTLRLLALTLPAYLHDFEGIYLIEEPENGIHPRAVETMFQSLSSVYKAQMLLATHSPVILNLAEARSVLCFAKNEEGATDIVAGDLHPNLQNWKGETSLGVLFAGGVLG